MKVLLDCIFSFNWRMSYAVYVIEGNYDFNILIGVQVICQDAEWQKNLAIYRETA